MPFWHPFNDRQTNADRSSVMESFRDLRYVARLQQWLRKEGIPLEAFRRWDGRTDAWMETRGNE